MHNASVWQGCTQLYRTWKESWCRCWYTWATGQLLCGYVEPERRSNKQIPDRQHFSYDMHHTICVIGASYVGATSIAFNVEWTCVTETVHSRRLRGGWLRELTVSVVEHYWTYSGTNIIHIPESELMMKNCLVSQHIVQLTPTSKMKRDSFLQEWFDKLLKYVSFWDPLSKKWWVVAM